jgi:hypothetical protein
MQRPFKPTELGSIPRRPIKTHTYPLQVQQKEDTK